MNDELPFAAGPFRVEAAPADTGLFARALGLPESGESGHMPVPLTFPVKWLVRPDVRDAIAALIAPKLTPIHDYQDIIYHRPVEAGACYDMLVRFGCASARGVTRLTIATSVRTRSGDVACTMLSGLLLAAPPNAAIAPKARHLGAPQAQRIRSGAEGGSIVSGTGVQSIVTGPIGSDVVDAYAAASQDFNPVHVDDAPARAMGFPGRIVHGMYIMGVMEGLVRRPAPPRSVRRINMRFVAPVLVGSSVVISARPVRDSATGTPAMRLTACNDSASLCCVGAAEFHAP